MSGLFGGSSSKAVMQASVPPSVTAEPAPTASSDPAALRRSGRASMLLSTGPQGVLGKPSTGRSQLLSA